MLPALLEMSRKNKHKLFSHHFDKFLWQFPDLINDGVAIKCVVCNKRLLCWKKQMCVAHLNTVTHKRKKSGETAGGQFVFDLIFMLSACNIPWHILDKQDFRRFWNKNHPDLTTLKLPSRRTLSRYLPPVREKLEQHLKYFTRNKKLWLTIDESTDSKNYVINIIVRSLDIHASSSPYLLASRRLKEYNDQVIKELVTSTLQKFEMSVDQLLFVVKGPSVMPTTGCLLNSICSNALQITCILHVLHLVSETVRYCYPKVNVLIVSTKEVFTKLPKYVWEFRKKYPDVPEPPRSDLTSWGAWLEAVFYYAKNFPQIKSLMLTFNTEECVAIRESQIKLQDTRVETDLHTIHNNYGSVGKAIKQLQNPSIPLRESFDILDKVQAALETVNDSLSVRVLNKLKSMLYKNPDFFRLRQIYNDSLPDDPFNSLKDYLNYAPITTLDVKQMTSVYKDIYSSRRNALKENTLETYEMLQAYSQAYPEFY